MRKRHLSLLCAGGLFLGAVSAASPGTSWSQDDCCTIGGNDCCSAGEDDCCSADAEGPCCTFVEKAGANAARRSGVSTLSLPLRGLRPETEAAFGKALRSVGRDLFECAGHPEATCDAPGTCDACGGAALAKRHVPAFRSMALEVSGMVQTCRVELTPGETVRLSAITNALRDCGVSLDLDGVRLGADARLHLADLTCTGCESKATTALESLASVVSSSCTFGTSEESVATMELCDSGGMEYAQVAKAVSDAGFRLADVSWTGAEAAPATKTYDLGITGFAKRLGGGKTQLLIHGLAPDGAAEQAGLEQGDRIVTINGGVAFEFTRDELTELLGTPEPIELVIERGDKTFTLEVTPQLITEGTDGDTDGARSAKSPGKSAARKKPSRGLPLGEAAPAVVGEDLDGIPFKLADYRGKVTVVTFWGFW